MTKKEDKTEMTFWQHLEELRWHIVRSVAAILILSIVAFLNREIIFDKIILAPSTSEFWTNRMLCALSEMLSLSMLCIENLHLKIINISMSGQFMIHMYISVMSGLVLAFPYVLWEIWRFVKPALLQKEKDNSRGAVIVASMLFYIGMAFSYFLIVPLTINFLGTYQVSETVENQIALRSFINTVISLSFAVGVVFELPIVVFFLTKIGVLTPMSMKKGRKYALIIVLLVSAVITPADIFSQIMVSIPLYILYEVSIGVSTRIYRKSKFIEDTL